MKLRNIFSTYEIKSVFRSEVEFSMECALSLYCCHKLRVNIIWFFTNHCIAVLGLSFVGCYVMASIHSEILIPTSCVSFLSLFGCCRIFLVVFVTWFEKLMVEMRGCIFLVGHQYRYSFHCWSYLSGMVVIKVGDPPWFCWFCIPYI